MVARNLIVTPDQYDNNPVVQPGTVRITGHVAAGPAAYMRTADPNSASGTVWFDEEYMPPGHFSFDRLCSAVQFRSAVAGSPAMVSRVTLLRESEVPA